jgi:acetyl/propionyl-CoA carboxylase alpha subunit
MSWLSKLINWATTSNKSGSGYYEHGVFKYHYKPTEPTEAEISALRRKIEIFEEHLNIYEFKECVMSFTQNIVSAYEMGNFIDINKMADSAYDNFLARLYQTTKYINQNPNKTRFEVDSYLKFDTVNVVEYYPILMNLIIYGDECTIARRASQHFIDKKNINQTIHGAIYNYALKVIPKIKEKHKEFKENEKKVEKNTMEKFEQELDELLNNDSELSKNNDVHQIDLYTNEINNEIDDANTCEDNNDVNIQEEYNDGTNKCKFDEEDILMY